MGGTSCRPTSPKPATAPSPTTGAAGDRSQFYKDLSAPFYGANRPRLDGLAGDHEREFDTDLLAFLRS